jgi:hypothetical protein
MSFEDQHIKIMDEISNTLISRCIKLYKIIIIRDILNCFASRFAAICDRENKYYHDKSINKLTKDLNFSELINRGGFFKTDSTIFDIWIEHNSYSIDSNYITFNYNKFLCFSEDYKKEIFKKLDIPYNELLFKEKSTYGHGSSYNPSNGQIVTKSKNDDYFWRFIDNICLQISDNKIIKKIDINFVRILNRILNDEMILEILRNNFVIDITKITNVVPTNKNSKIKQEPYYKIKICSEERLIKFPEFLYYMSKYLKYKNKYLAYKNLIR